MPPRRTGRSSARSSVSREFASSPPKPQNILPSTAGRVTRSGRTARSESIDLDEKRQTAQNATSKRALRHTSVESGDDNATAGPRRTRGQAKQVQPDVRGTGRNLSIVAEEMDGASDDMNEGAEAEESESASFQNLPTGTLASPSRMSQISGTTAFSAATSIGVTAAEEIDPDDAEKLPELFATSAKILQILAPSDASEQDVESIVRDLRTSGSGLAGSLKEKEDSFNEVKELFGHDDYISLRIVHLALLGGEKVEDGPYRPDAIIYVANIATLVKDSLVVQDARRREFLMTLSRFPEPFLASFGDGVEFGRSALLDETFELALDVRTQYLIATFSQFKGEDEFNPEEYLANEFFDEVDEWDPEADYFDDVLAYWHPKGLKGGKRVSDKQISMLVDRVNDVRSAFRDSKAAQEAGDLIDFDLLEKMFPWLQFLTHLVTWGRARFVELETSMMQQGGVDNITDELRMFIRKNDNQEGLLPAPKLPEPESKLKQRPAEVKALKLGTSKAAIRVFERLKRASTGSSPALSKEPSGPPRKRQRVQTADPVAEAFMLPGMSDEEHQLSPPSNADNDDDDQIFVSTLHTYDASRNKENRPLPQSSTNVPKENVTAKSAKPSLLDPQPNAVRVQWDTQESSVGPSTDKRPQRFTADDDMSEDEGFQNDQRILDQSRFKKLPAAREVSRPAKPIQSNREVVKERLAPARPGGRTALNSAGPRYVAEVQVEPEADEEEEVEVNEVGEDEVDEEEDEMEDEDPEDPPRPTAREVRELSKRETAKTKASRAARSPSATVRPQVVKRKGGGRWSAAEEQHLIDLIEEYGTSWVTLEKLGGFRVHRDQVALKDKARNLKVNYAKSGLPLPLNFKGVTVSKELKRKIREVNPDWESENSD